MRENTKHIVELKKIGNYIEKIYVSFQDNDNFSKLDKIVSKFCDPIDQYNNMYISDCCLYMNEFWARDFENEIKTFERMYNGYNNLSKIA